MSERAAGDGEAHVVDPRVRDVVEQAPALTAVQVDQLRDLLPPLTDRAYRSATDAA